MSVEQTVDESVLNAVEEYKNRPKTSKSEAIVDAAGTMIAKRLDNE